MSRSTPWLYCKSCRRATSWLCCHRITYMSWKRARSGKTAAAAFRSLPHPQQQHRFFVLIMPLAVSSDKARPAVNADQPTHFCASGTSSCFKLFHFAAHRREHTLTRSRPWPPSLMSRAVGWDPCNGLGAPNYPTMQSLVLFV